LLDAVGRIIAGNDLAFAVRDAYPISPGHTLIVTRRHVASFFEVTDDERKRRGAARRYRAKKGRVSKGDVAKLVAVERHCCREVATD
jgi:hypothetical protein